MSSLSKGNNSNREVSVTAVEEALRRGEREKQLELLVRTHLIVHFFFFFFG
jgi:hypothetical protein